MATIKPEGLLPLLRADPHRWGAGLVHLIDADRDQLMCGKTPANCPGDKLYGWHRHVTCKACLRSIEARRKWIEAEYRAAEEAARHKKLQEERAARQREWWPRYNAYLLSPEWQRKRRLVLQRAGGACEGCGERRAVQVHHMRYPQGVMPGTPQWIAQEKLFDLRAVCLKCHHDVHADVW